MWSVKMNKAQCFSGGWGQAEGSFRLEEDRYKRLLEKPQEVDEACYSLEESSPDLDETVPVNYVNGNRSTGDYKRSDSGRERSLPTEECCSDTRVIGVFDNAFRAVYHRVNDASPPQPTFNAGRTFQLRDFSNTSGALIPRGVAEFFPSDDQLIPDFDHLLSNDVEVGEDSNDYIKRKCQQMVQDGCSSHQIYSELNESRFGGKLYDLGAEDSFDDVSTDGSIEDSSWTEKDCSAMIESMRRSMQCADDSCKEKKCQLGRELIATIKVDLEDPSLAMSLSTRRLLSAIIDHSDGCEDMSCVVPWCSYFTQYRETHCSVEEKRASLRSWYRRMELTQDFEELNVDIPETADFIQLDLDVVWPCVEHHRMHKDELACFRRTLPLLRKKENIDGCPPLEEMKIIPRNGIDFLVDGHFGRYGQLGLTALSTTVVPGAMMLNIVQYMTSENSKDLWMSLVGLRHPNFVRHLWVCVDGNNVTVCRDHSCMDSESLESLVKKVKAPHRIGNDEIIRYATGLVSATTYLNDRGIFYLRWIASGIQLNYDYSLARLSDFSSAVNSSAIEEDEEVVDVVVNCLPPYILPPEIFRGEELCGRIGAYTEVWGVGCIIYHMCCRHPVHHAMRHEPPEKLLQMVEEYAPGEHLRSVGCRVMLSILSKIFRYEAERISLPHLERLLQESLSFNRR